MILIFGGAYQGKLEYAIKKYNIREDEIYKCSTCSTEIDLSKKVIYGLDKFTYASVKEGLTPLDFVKENLEKLSDKIIICDDISQGIVPMDKTERAWREANGRCMIFLANEASEVYRIFCGLENKIK